LETDGEGEEAASRAAYDALTEGRPGVGAADAEGGNGDEDGEEDELLDYEDACPPPKSDGAAEGENEDANARGEKRPRPENRGARARVWARVRKKTTDVGGEGWGKRNSDGCRGGEGTLGTAPKTACPGSVGAMPAMKSVCTVNKIINPKQETENVRYASRRWARGEGGEGWGRPRPTVG